MKKIFKKVHNSIYLLISILVFSFVVPVLYGNNIKTLLFEVSYSVMLFSIFSIIDKKTKYLRYILLVSISTIWLNHFIDYNIVKYVTYTFSTLVLLVVTGVMIYQVVNSKFITSKVIIETISGYLLLGVVLFFLNLIILSNNPNAISFGGNDNSEKFSDVIYYSYITISTIGYGEITPVSPEARSLSIFFGVISQLYLALIIAFILGKYINVKQNETD